MNHLIEIHHPADRRARQMGESLARAFYEEPNFTYVFPDAGRRQRALTWFFGSFVTRIGLRYGRVHTTPEGAGGAVWIHPDGGPTSWGSLQAGLLAMPLHLGLDGTRRSAALGGHVDRVRKQVAPPRHWYLMALGVDPAAQGRGLGGDLLQPILARADVDNIPCYLDTFRERTTTFYHRFGFEVVHTDAVPDEGPAFWCMTREPQSSPV